MDLQGDNPFPWLDLGEHGLALLTNQAGDIGILAPGVERYFHQLQRQLRGQALGIFMPTVLNPLGHARADRDQTQTHEPSLFPIFQLV
ncbi:hypothetical protein D3C79_588390 [compost metagenome]